MIKKSPKIELTRSNEKSVPPVRNYNREWISFPDIKPEPYDLVNVRYENYTTQILWWTGYIWDGSEDKKKMKIIAWKRK